MSPAATSAAPGDVGFVGLGNMGAALAANLANAGLTVVCHDVAGPQRCPQGAIFVDSLDQLAQRAEVVVLSLPDGAVSEQVARGISLSRPSSSGFRGHRRSSWSVRSLPRGPRPATR